MNPIIETIDAGHISHGTRCLECRQLWPCAAILRARRDNHDYAQTRQHDAALAKASR